MNWQARVDELRAIPQKYGRPMGIWPIRDTLRAEGYKLTQTELRDYLEIGSSRKRQEPQMLEKVIEQSPGHIIPAPMEKSEQKGMFPRLADEFFDWIERSEPAFEPKPAPEERTEGVVKYAVFSDVHAPFHHPQRTRKALEMARSLGCTVGVWVGDTYEFKGISSHSKKDQHKFKEEIAKCRLFAEWAFSYLDDNRIVEGNHDGETGRWGRAIAGEVSQHLQWLVRSPWELILADIPNARLVGHQASFDADEARPGEETLGWLYQIGKDAIVAHWEKSSSAQGLNVEKLRDWIIAWAPVLGFTSNPRWVATGHTHRSTLLNEVDCQLIETGTLASFGLQSYQFQAPNGSKGTNRKPGTPSWVYLEQVDGVTDLDKTRIYRL